MRVLDSVGREEHSRAMLLFDGFEVVAAFSRALPSPCKLAVDLQLRLDVTLRRSFGGPPNR